MELEDAEWRLEHEEPPTEEAEHEWYRMERERLRRQEEQLIERTTGGGGGGGRQQQEQLRPKQVTRTTAQPRPNAYIPDELGIPKPYGLHAPFKPSEAGSTMRHIRLPQPREIKI